MAFFFFLATFFGGFFVFDSTTASLSSVSPHISDATSYALEKLQFSMVFINSKKSPLLFGHGHPPKHMYLKLLMPIHSDGVLSECPGRKHFTL